MMLAAALAFLMCSSPVAAAPESLFITIDRVELKSAEGVWVSVIRPDKKVDLVTTEPAIAFFNNQGRIQAGGYVNVRLTVSGETPFSLSAKNDFPPLTIKKGAFVRVKFKLDLEKSTTGAIDWLSLVVDNDRREFGPAEISMET